MLNLKLPFTGEDLTKELIRRQVLPQDASPELKARACEFEAIYRRLPQMASELTDFYRKLAESYGKNPGIVVLYMVGGRVKGKPLSLDSDIDLVFAVENGRDSIKAYECPAMIQYAQQLANKHNVKHELHIVDYGSGIPQSLEATLKSIPLAISNPEAKSC